MSDPVAESWERGLRAAALVGDAVAWRALYDSAADTVARYATWRTGNDDLADEVNQEAWLTAAKRLSAFDPSRGRFAGWVCGIAARSAMAIIRKKLIAAKRVRALATVPEPAIEEPDEKDPQRVALALAAISESHELVLRAKYFEQQSVDEIAAANGETAKAVESRLTRAREAFRQEYSRLGDES